MTVRVELFGQLSPASSRHQVVEIKKPETVQALVDRLGLKPAEVGLIVINGVQSELDDMVPVDCRLCFFPHVSGG
jgi:molybdopterin converting factor small subunit